MTPSRSRARRCGEDGGEAIAPEADDIAGERGEIAEQRVEAVHREGFAIGRVGAFAGGLALRRRGGLGLGHRRGALRLARGRIGLVEQHRGEASAHVPLQIIGQHAEQDVRAHLRCVQWNTGRNSRSTVFSERKACSTPLRLL